MPPATPSPASLVSRGPRSLLASDRDDFSSMLVRYWKHGATSAQAVRFYDPVSASGRFMPRILFREGEEGLYSMEVFLFWPGAQAQYARCTLTPVRVVAPPSPQYKR